MGQHIKILISICRSSTKDIAGGALLISFSEISSANNADVLPKFTFKSCSEIQQHMQFITVHTGAASFF